MEEIRIKAGKTPDELVEQIRGLADRCNFPIDTEKERHIQFRMVRGLSDTDLIWKLLAMKIDATTAEMLAVCQTHIAIADNMSLMGLANKAIGTVQKMKKPQSHGSTCGNCTKHHTPGREHCPGLHLSCLPECWSLEAEVQEVKQGQGFQQETQVTISSSTWRKEKGR